MGKIRTCWQCGCTDDHACPGGCYWLSFTGKPTCSNCATPKQVKVLRALYEQPTIRAAMRAIGNRATSLGADYVRRLQERGFVSRSVGGRWGERKLTTKGLNAIGLKPCYHCRATGALPAPPRRRRA